MSIELLNGDCFELIKNVPDKSIDFVLTDPPYEFKNGGFGGEQTELSHRMFIKELYKNPLFHQEFNAEKLMSEIERVCKKVNCVIFGTEPMILDLMKYAEGHKYIYALTLWYKTNPPPFVNGSYLKDIELALLIREKGVVQYGKYETLSRVFESPVNKHDKDLWHHPTMKPVELMSKYIINHTKKGDTVLDLYAGLGSTAIACKIHERNFIGFEIDKEYYTKALKRIEQYKVQPTLFD